MEHFLLNCGLYDEERDRLRRKVETQRMRVSVLLGDTEAIKETIEYIKSARSSSRSTMEIYRRHIQEKPSGRMEEMAPKSPILE